MVARKAVGAPDRDPLSRLDDGDDAGTLQPDTLQPEDMAERLRAADARIETLLAELLELEKRDQFDSGARAHFMGQLAEREDIIRRQTADIIKLKNATIGKHHGGRMPSVILAIGSLIARLSRPKRMKK